MLSHHTPKTLPFRETPKHTLCTDEIMESKFQCNKNHEANTILKKYLWNYQSWPLISLYPAHLNIDEASYPSIGGTFRLGHEVAAELAPQWQEWLFSSNCCGICTNRSSLQLVSSLYYYDINFVCAYGNPNEITPNMAIVRWSGPTPIWKHKTSFTSKLTGCHTILSKLLWTS